MVLLQLDSNICGQYTLTQDAMAHFTSHSMLLFILSFCACAQSIINGITTAITPLIEFTLASLPSCCLVVHLIVNVIATKSKLLVFGITEPMQNKVTKWNLAAVLTVKVLCNSSLNLKIIFPILQNL